MKEKEFHLGDVLSIITGRLVSPQGIDGVFKILDFMTGDILFTLQLQRALNECQPYLLAQFPHLNTSEMDFAVAELDKMADGENRETELENLASRWLAKQVVKYGEKLLVRRLPKGVHQFKGPIEEREEQMRKRKKTIVVTTKKSKKIIKQED